MLTVVITGRIQYDPGDGKPTEHRQLRADREHEREVMIWGRMIPLSPGGWELMDSYSAYEKFPQQVACRFIDQEDHIEWRYEPNGSMRVEVHGHDFPRVDFVATIENNSAEHVLERVFQAYAEYADSEAARDERARTVQDLRNHMERELHDVERDCEKRRNEVTAIWGAKIKAVWDETKDGADAHHD